MDKNWLIRTKSNHILGPVSKEKVIELYHNGSIKPDDEVCSGNGYWFFIREDDLVNRFLLGSETQSYNPISEAKNVLVMPPDTLKNEDLENDITLVGGINVSMLRDEKSSRPVEVLPSIDNAEIVVTELKPKKNNMVPKKKSRLEEKVGARKVYVPSKQQNWIKYLGIIGILVLFLLVYFRKTIIQNFFSDLASFRTSLFSIAIAQETATDKKKSFLSQR